MALGSKLKEHQQLILDRLYDLVLNPNISIEERRMCLNTKNRIEWGHSFDGEMNDLMNSLSLRIKNSTDVNHFMQFARDHRTGPALLGSRSGSWE